MASNYDIEQYIARGAARMGVSEYAVVSTDFESLLENQWEKNGIGSGTTLLGMTGTTGGGVVVQGTGATAGRKISAWYGKPTGGDRITRLTRAASAQKFYGAFRLRLIADTAGDNFGGSGAGFALRNITALTIWSNIYGIRRNTGASATKYQLFGSDGAIVDSIDSTINLDDGYHDVEVWYDGNGILYGSVDNETPLVLALSPAVVPTISLMCLLFATNGTVASSVFAFYDFAIWMSETT